ncbi:MAG TPA: hypothetical protein VLH40_00635 [Atribacteraceae bacterium]|nr:hypothetical protein [Atribacteraceae bacterium]
MNPFISVSSINRLVRFSGDKVPVTSFYLNIDRLISNRDILLEGNSLLEQGRKLFLTQTSLKPESVSKDFRSIEKYLNENLPAMEHLKGLVIFSCTERDWFDIFHLPHPIRSRVVVGELPYLRPLLAVLDNYHRIMLAVVDHREARLFEVFLGQIREHDNFHTPIRGRIKAGGLAGVEEWRIERRMENRIIQHYKDVADSILNHCRQEHFDTLVVGMKEEDYPDFLRVLHTYPRKRLAFRVNLNPKSTQKEIIEEALRLEREVRDNENRDALERLIKVVGNDGAAVVGLPGVIRSVHLGACQTLIVDESYREPGVLCESCGRLALSAEECDQCGGGVLPIPDIVGEVVEEALLHSGEIRFVQKDDPLLPNIKRIGTFLRFLV